MVCGHAVACVPSARCACRCAAARVFSEGCACRALVFPGLRSEARSQRLAQWMTFFRDFSAEIEGQWLRAFAHDAGVTKELREALQDIQLAQVCKCLGVAVCHTVPVVAALRLRCCGGQARDERAHPTNVRPGALASPRALSRLGAPC